MPASLRSNRYPATCLGSAQSLYQWKPRGHSPYPKVVWRNLTATAPRSRCSSRFMRWRTTLFCRVVLNFPLIHAPGSRFERPQTRTTADVADVANFADVRRVLTRSQTNSSVVSNHRSQFRTERLADLQRSRNRRRTTSPRTRRIPRLIHNPPPDGGDCPRDRVAE